MSRKNDAKKQHRPLTDRQKKFVLCYIANGLNALKAYKEAGYSEKTAEKAVYRLLGSVGIQNEIERLTSKTTQKLDIKADRVVSEMANIALSPGITGIANWDKEGNITFTASDELSDDMKRCVAEVRQSKLGTSIKMFDRVHALEVLGSWMGLVKNTTTINNTTNIDARSVTLQQLPPNEQQSEVNRILGVIRSVGYDLPSAVQVDEVFGRYNNTNRGEIVDCGASCEAELPNRERTNAVEGVK